MLTIPLVVILIIPEYQRPHFNTLPSRTMILVTNKSRMWRPPCDSSLLRVKEDQSVALFDLDDDPRYDFPSYSGFASLELY